MLQGTTNQWIHLLPPVRRTSSRALGDAPTRSLAAFAKRVGLAAVDQSARAPLFAMTAPNDGSSVPKR